MVLDSVKNLVFPSVRRAYIANNYFGVQLMSHLISENEILQLFVSEMFESLSSSSVSSTSFTINVRSSLSQVEQCLLSDSEFFSALYETSFTPDYDRLEQQLQASLFPQNLSSTTLSKLVEFWMFWSNELLSDALFLYSISEFQMIFQMIQQFYLVTRSLISVNHHTRNLLKNHLQPLHFSILYCSSNLFYLQKAKSHLLSLSNAIELFLSRLRSHQMVSTSDHQLLKTYFPLFLSHFSPLSNNRYSLWKSTFSLITQLTSSLQYNVLLVNDSAAIYADADAPQSNSSLNAWSYTNQSASRKINWYFCSYYNNTLESLLWSNISSIFFVVRFESIVSLPYLTIYTKNQSNSYWYGKRKNYTQFTSTPPLQQWVLVYYGSDPSSDVASYVPTLSATIPLQHVSDSINFKTYVGGTDLNPNDSILFLTLSTDSSASVQNVSFSTFLIGYKTNTQMILHRTLSSFPTLLS